MATKCPKCNADNPDTKQFCGDCGTQLGQDIPEVTRTIETPPQELTRGTVFADRYEIIEQLGIGGMGAVYRVEDKKAKEEIALKLIKPEIAADKKTIDRFRNELTTARKIRHKNICGMYDLGEDKGSYYITMEYVPGEDLKGFIKRAAPVSIERAISITKQVCDGLAEAHQLGVVHRDLKPSNIMIDKDGNARIMDFGLARTLETRGITDSGVMIGTPEYFSPEQAETKEVDHRSDIYSLGVILYEMLTGQRPFEGETALSVARKHADEIPKDPKEINPQIPDDLNGVIMKCLEKEKEKRYQNASELRKELENVEKGIPTTDREIPKRKPLTSKEITVIFGLKKLLAPALIFIAIVIIGVVIWQLLPEKEVAPSETIKPTVAVLPFEDLSPNKDQSFLCDGFSESLINALTKIKDLRIPARTSSFFFRGREHDLQEIGGRLNVQKVLEGSVQRARGELRITVKLINVSDESVQWSKQYNQTLDDVFTIQDEITLNVVKELKVRLSGVEREELAKRETTSTEAYQLYLQGRHFRWIENNKNYLKAKHYFEQAINVDPNYSSAYAGLADTYMLLGLFSMMPRDEAAQQAYDSAKKALELDENSSEAHTSMGVILEVFNWDWQGAEREFKSAIALNPNHFGAHFEYGLLLYRLKRLDEAEFELEKSIQIDPLSVVGYSFLGYVYRLKGDLKKAKEQHKKRDELNTQIFSGENAVEIAQKLIERDGRLPQHLRQLSRAYIQSGQDAEARLLLDELKRLYEESHLGNIAYQTACVYLYLDEKDQALSWLERACEKHDPLLIVMNTSMVLDPVRQDPRFKSILKKMGLD